MTRRRRAVPVRAAAVAAALVAGTAGLIGAPAATAAPSASAVRAQEWWLDDLHLPDAWKVTKGSGVVVGLVDTGVDPTHPDLHDAFVPGKDVSGTGSPTGEQPVAGDPHGTTMAGYIAGRGHSAGNGQGLIGAAPGARVMSVSRPSDGSKVPDAIRYAADHGAKVINLSFGTQRSDALEVAVKHAEQRDVVLVAAAGNEGIDNSINDLATYPGVVAVDGYVDDNHFSIDGDSNFAGPETEDPSSAKASDYRGGVALAAPFETHDGRLDMIGTTTVNHGSYAYGGGTSNSAALVSGVVALIRSAHPTWTAAQVIDVLIHTAQRPAGAGYSPKHGFGIPDAAKAVAASAPSVCDNPLGSLVTDSAGVWEPIANNEDALAYTPHCGSTTSSSPPATSSAPASPTTSASVPASSAPSDPASSSPAAAAGGGSSGGVPAWVWIVVAVLVVGGAGGFLLARQRRPAPAGPGSGPAAPPGGWPQQPPPPPGWQPPPPGWTPPKDPGR